MPVTASPEPDSGSVPSPTTPREVRRALLPEEVGQFDSAAHRRMLQRVDQILAGEVEGAVGVVQLREIVVRRLDFS